MVLRDLAAATDLTAAQAHAYLASFRRIELVEQNAATGQYNLGPFAMRLGMTRASSYPPLAAASEAASNLSRDLGFMVCVVVWGPQAPTVIQVHDGIYPLNLNIHEGTLFSVTGTASGRLFGALLKSDAVDKRIESEFDGTVVKQGIGRPPSRGELRSLFAEIRANGYSTSIGTPLPGVNAISAPVFGEDGQLSLAITVVASDDMLPLTANDPTRKTLAAVTTGLSQSAKRDGSGRGAAA
jgi:DNA-binding IclR family transcriptional regulator